MSSSEQTIERVWAKGGVIPGYNQNLWRKDPCGAPIKRTDYGDRKSKYGWEIDHIIPDSRGGSDHISNLRPLQWQNNASKSDDRLTCPVR
jgi:5-methylcytosine-specific restriction endonuclease McrA